MIRGTKKICLVALACGMLVGCAKSGVTDSEIRFIATSGASMTRTAYSEYESDNKERVDWVLGDLFTVWSDKARHIQDVNRHDADYIVQIISTTNASGETATNGLYSRAIVDPVDHNGLQWGDDAGPFQFYARYPADNTKIDGTSMSGTIPSEWDGTNTPKMTWSTKTEGSITRTIGKPDMAYAYMFASAKATNNAEAVRLDFNPMFTAFQFTVGSGNNEEVNLTSFTLETLNEDSHLSGDFTLTYDGNVISFDDDAPQYVTVNLTGKKVTPTTPLTFTVFAAPVNLSNLRITFEGTEIGVRTLDLKYSETTTLSGVTPGAFIEFGACKKHIINNITFPQLLDANGEYIEWDQEAFAENLIWDN